MLVTHSSWFLMRKTTLLFCIQAVDNLVATDSLILPSPHSISNSLLKVGWTNQTGPLHRNRESWLTSHFQVGVRLSTQMHPSHFSSTLNTEKQWIIEPMFRPCGSSWPIKSLTSTNVKKHICITLKKEKSITAKPTSNKGTQYTYNHRLTQDTRASNRQRRVGSRRRRY